MSIENEKSAYFLIGILMRNSFFFRFIVLTGLFCLCRVAVATVPDIAERLNFVWRLHYTTNDRMSSNSSSEYTTYSSSREGQYYYLLSNSKADTAGLYRLFNGSDHKDSTLTSDGSYAYNATLGYAYTQQEPGTTEIKQWYRSSPLDYAIYRPSEPTLTGYALQSLPVPVYAYPRYGTSDTSTSNMLSLTGGGVTIQSNLVAGGAIFSWVHNGKEYININDYGRELQAAYFASYSDASGSWAQINPTEAGSYRSFQTIAAALRQGSPVETAYNDGLTQITRSIPLDFNPGPNPNTTVDLGGDDYHPILWPTCRLGKNITLNYNNMGPVAKYETYVVAPADTYSAGLEIPTAYLTGDFTNYWSYDAATSTLTPVSVALNGGVELMPASGFGGVIISTSSNINAMGVYGVGAQYGGSAAAFALYNFSQYGLSSHTASDTTKWAVGGARAGLDASKEYTFTTWVMSGTLAEVQGYMNALYAANVVGAVKVTPLDPNEVYRPEDRDDIVVFKPSAGQWPGSHTTAAPPDYLNGTVTTQADAFGTSADKPLIGDVNGDGLDDLVVVRPVANFNWYASHTLDVNKDGVGELNGGAAESQVTGFGSIVGNRGCFLADINGDSYDDIATCNPDAGWHVVFSGLTGLGGGSGYQAGPKVVVDAAKDKPLVGDFNGDGYADICIFTSGWGGSNQWCVVKSKASGFGTFAYPVNADTVIGFFGLSGDIPLVGDINGDGRDDAVVVRNDGSGNMQWVAAFSDANGLVGGSGAGNTATFGFMTDIPVLADINGDGRMDIGYVRSDGAGGRIWRFALTTRSGAFTNFAAVSTTFGATGDIPLIGQLNAVMPGDVNKDDSVTVIDLQAFAAAWLATPWDAGWNKNCEMALPKDGRINLKDFAVLAGNWLVGTN